MVNPMRFKKEENDAVNEKFKMISDYIPINSAHTENEL